MRTPALLALALLAAACGESPDEPASLPASVEIRGLDGKDIGYLQLTVLNNATKYTCPRDCLASHIKQPDGTLTDVVRIKGEDGQAHNALRVAVDATKLLGDGQALSVRMPTGTTRMIVAEVLSTDGTKLLAIGCEVLTQVNGGTNPAVIVRTLAINPPPACDPRID